MIKPHLQQTLLDIHNFQIANSRMPTIRELQLSVSDAPRSISCIQDRIRRLTELGYLTQQPGQYQSFRTMRFGKQIDIIDGKIPVLGVCN